MLGAADGENCQLLAIGRHRYIVKCVSTSIASIIKHVILSGSVKSDVKKINNDDIEQVSKTSASKRFSIQTLYPR